MKKGELISVVLLISMIALAVGVLFFGNSSITGFTIFTSNVNTNLTIYDQNDTEVGLPAAANISVFFYANYTKTNGAPVDPAAFSAGCNISINSSVTDGVMAYDYGIGVYYFSYTFSDIGTYNWNVTCYSSLGSLTTSDDDITIVANSLPTQGKPLIFSEFGTNTTVEDLYAVNQSTSDDGITYGHPVTNIYTIFVDAGPFYYPVVNLYMPFDTFVNSTGTGLVRDYSGQENIPGRQANNGTLGGGNADNAPTWTTDAFSGGAYSFDGNDYIHIPYSDSFDYSAIADDGFSIQAWVKITKPLSSGTDWHTIIFFGNDTNYMDFSVSDYNSPDNLALLFEAASPTESIISSANCPNHIRVGEFHHVLLSYNNENQALYFFVDGAFCGQSSLTYSPLPALDFVRIGYHSNTARMFNGTIDNLRFLLSSLDAVPEQIVFMYQNAPIISDEVTNAENPFLFSVTPNDGFGDGPTNYTDALTVIRNLSLTLINVNNNDQIGGSLAVNTTSYLAANFYTGDEGIPSPYGTCYLNVSELGISEQLMQFDGDSQLWLYPAIFDSYGTFDWEVSCNLTPALGGAVFTDSHQAIINNKLRFSKDVYYFNATRKFNAFKLEAVNDNVVSYSKLYATITDKSEPMDTISFIGVGTNTTDTKLKLLAGQSVNLTVGATFDQFLGENFSFNVSLINLSEDTVDTAEVYLNFPDPISSSTYDFELSNDNITIAICAADNAQAVCAYSQGSVTIFNNGTSPISDLSITNITETFPIVFDPKLSNYLLESGESVTVNITLMLNNSMVNQYAVSTFNITGANKTKEVTVIYNGQHGCSCGDGTVSSGEQCEGSGSIACPSGYTGGTAYCKNCIYDFSTCNDGFSCGNSNVEPGEDCEGSDTALCRDISSNFFAGLATCDSGKCEWNMTDCMNIPPLNVCNLDGVCTPGTGERCDICTDCGTCAPVCGDNKCESAKGESCLVCEDDCGQCHPSSVCGNLVCDTFEGESCINCPGDCGICPPRCGDGICNGAENYITCLKDCPSPQRCGNGILESKEACEIGNTKACTSLPNSPFTSGTASCKKDCSGWDTLACRGSGTYCGDGTANGAEQCDSSDVRGLSCTSSIFGGAFSTGSVSCGADCNLNTSECKKDLPNGTDENNTIIPGDCCDGFLCINHPETSCVCNAPGELPIPVSDLGNVNRILVAVSFSDSCRSYQVHDTFFYVNGHLAYTLLQQVPLGLVVFEIDKSWYSQSNSVMMTTSNYAGGNSGGHFCASSSTDFIFEMNTYSSDPNQNSLYCPITCINTSENEYGSLLLNGLDDDCDGLMDCADPDACLFPEYCQNDPGFAKMCGHETDCTDQIDNDMNGLTDCEDQASCCADYACENSVYCQDYIKFCDWGDLNTTCWLVNPKKGPNIAKYNLSWSNLSLNNLVIMGSQVLFNTNFSLNASGNIIVKNRGFSRNVVNNIPYITFADFLSFKVLDYSRAMWLSGFGSNFICDPNKLLVGQGAGTGVEVSGSNQQVNGCSFKGFSTSIAVYGGVRCSIEQHQKHF